MKPLALDAAGTCALRTVLTWEMEQLVLDIWSDVICPWCYLGHVRVEEAIEITGLGDEVSLRRRAFQLDPRATSTPGDLRQAIEHKYGPGSFDAMSTRLDELGNRAGIDYRFDLAQRVGTMDAHRLIQWAQNLIHGEENESGPPDALVERLYRAYFTEGVNIADRQNLADLASEVELDRAGAAAMLAGEEYREVVLNDHQEAIENGITGVPAVTFRGAVIIPGAQEVDTMARVLTRLHAKVTAAAP